MNDGWSSIFIFSNIDTNKNLVAAFLVKRIDLCNLRRLLIKE